MTAREIVRLTRRYWFCASHRLHNPVLDDSENARVYGKCNNVGGHGHNYRLEVTLAGPVDPRTGMVVHLQELDECVQQQVLALLDRSHLNDLSNFQGRIPTTENLSMEVHRLLKESIGSLPSARSATLESVRLEETSSNFFEYRGEGFRSEKSVALGGPR